MRCSKCGEPICTTCIVQTPVGYRCRHCAQLRRLPQYEVGVAALLRAVGTGLLTSVACWFLVLYEPYLGYFISILVGVAVSEVMSRMAQRRSNRVLEAGAVACIVVGLLAAWAIHAALLGHHLYAANAGAGFVVPFALPALIASFVAVVRLR